MATLSFDKSEDSNAIAFVKGGDYDKEILYLHKKDTPSKVKPTPKKEISPALYNNLTKGMKQAEKVKLFNAMRDAMEQGLNDLPGASEAHKALYQRVRNDIQSEKGIELPEDCTFQVIPSPDPSVRNIWYVAGISGSGKSYFARGVAEAYKKLFPDREVYLISKLEQDDTLDNMKVNGKLSPPKRISLESLKTDYPALEEFDKCLIIFDDYDTLQEPYGKIVQNLIDDLAIQGRHTTTSMLVLSHYLTNYKKTRLILGEAHFIVLYPMATSFKAMRYVCETHCGLTKEEVQSLKKLGRWVCVHKVYPQYLISAHKAFPLNQ